MRVFFSLFFFVSIALSSVLTPNEAFKITQGSNSQGVFVRIELADGIFLYKNRFKVALSVDGGTAFIDSFEKFTNVVIKDGEEVIYHALRAEIPRETLDETRSSKLWLRVFYQGCSDSGFCYRPMSADFEITRLKNNGETLYKIAPFVLKSPPNSLNLGKNGGIFGENSILSGKNIENSGSNSNEFMQYLQGKNLPLILAVFFVYGLLLSLTPCNLPMVPILSSLILTQNAKNSADKDTQNSASKDDTQNLANKNAPNTKNKDTQSKKRAFGLSFVFVLFMSLAYAIAGVITAILGASVQGLLQKPLVLCLFAALLVLLALACFGFFSLSLPQGLAKFTPKCKGVLGVAIMGFLSAFIVGPCVAAPLAAALLYIATSGDFILGGLSLFVLSFGMGVPLLALGLGLGFIRAGAWMQRVNVFFGFVMLAMAVWVLARILPNGVILALYGVLGVFFAVFMGLFDGSNSNLARLKKAILTLVLAYSLSLFLGGLWGGKSLLNPLNLGTQNEKSGLNFEFMSDLNEIQNALAQNDKVLLYFTASWCENCRLLESFTFSDERVQGRLKDYKLIKIDISDNDEKQYLIMKEFGVFAPPVLIFYKDKAEFSRLVGFVRADGFLEKMP